MLDGLKIRPYEESDRDAVIELWHECGLIVPWNDPVKDIEAKLKVQREYFLVAELEGNVIGTAMAGYEGHRGWVNYLGVSRKFRRFGIARLLMEEIERCFRSIGCPKINLQIRFSNREAIGFYEAIGYKDDEVISYGKRLDNTDEKS